MQIVLYYTMEKFRKTRAIKFTTESVNSVNTARGQYNFGINISS